MVFALPQMGVECRLIGEVGGDVCSRKGEGLKDEWEPCESFPKGKGQVCQRVDQEVLSELWG